MKSHLLERAKRLASRPYPFRVYKDTESDSDVMYLASNLDLDGCMAQGASQIEAINNLADAHVDYISFLLEKGLPVPEPSELAPTATSAPNQGVFVLTEVRNPETSIMDVLNSPSVTHLIQPEEDEVLYEASLRTST